MRSVESVTERQIQQPEATIGYGKVWQLSMYWFQGKKLYVLLQVYSMNVSVTICVGYSVT